jgi:hypothetical protein
MSAASPIPGIIVSMMQDMIESVNAQLKVHGSLDLVISEEDAQLSMQFRPAPGSSGGYHQNPVIATCDLGTEERPLDQNTLAMLMCYVASRVLQATQCNSAEEIIEQVEDFAHVADALRSLQPSPLKPQRTRKKVTWLPLSTSELVPPSTSTSGLIPPSTSTSGLIPPSPLTHRSLAPQGQLRQPPEPSAQPSTTRTHGPIANPQSKPSSTPSQPAQHPVPPVNNAPTQPLKSKPAQLPVKPTQLPGKPAQLPGKPAQLPVKPVQPAQLPVKPVQPAQLPAPHTKFSPPPQPNPTQPHVKPTFTVVSPPEHSSPQSQPVKPAHVKSTPQQQEARQQQTDRVTTLPSPPAHATSPILQLPKTTTTLPSRGQADNLTRTPTQNAYTTGPSLEHTSQSYAQPPPLHAPKPAALPQPSSAINASSTSPSPPPPPPPPQQQQPKDPYFIDWDTLHMFISVRNGVQPFNKELLTKSYMGRNFKTKTPIDAISEANIESFVDEMLSSMDVLIQTNLKNLYDMIQNNENVALSKNRIYLMIQGWIKVQAAYLEKIRLGPDEKVDTSLFQNFLRQYSDLYTHFEKDIKKVNAYFAKSQVGAERRAYALLQAIEAIKNKDDKRILMCMSNFNTYVYNIDVSSTCFQELVYRYIFLYRIMLKNKQNFKDDSLKEFIAALVVMKKKAGADQYDDYAVAVKALHAEFKDMTIMDENDDIIYLATK